MKEDQLAKVSRLGGIISRFRRKLDLEPVPGSDGSILVDSLKIPFTYCWSPGLVSKPRDWHPHIGTSSSSLIDL